MNPTLNLAGYGQSSITNPINVPGTQVPAPSVSSPSNLIPAPVPAIKLSTPVTPTVVTPQAATKDLQGIQANLQQTQAQIAAQAQKVAADKAAADAKTAADAAAKVVSDKAASDAALTSAKTNALNGGYSPNLTNQLSRGNDQIDTVTSNPDGTTSTVTYKDGTSQNVQGQYGTGSNSTQTSLQSSADSLSAQMLKNAQTTFNTITNYQNGTIPLTAGEQAQVDGLKQQFQTLIDQQTLANTGAAGIANVRGYQTGAAEYDPTFQTEKIGAIVSAGANKIADLNTKMTSSVATLEQGFKDNDIKAVQQANDAYQSAAKDRLAEINKQVDAAAQVVKDAAAAKQAETDKLNTAKLEAVKNGAPKALVNGATDINDLINKAGDYMQTATGTLGDYLQYNKDAQASGITPTDFSTFKAAQDAQASKLKVSEAYGTAFATAKGKAAGENAGGGSPQVNSPVESPLGITYNIPASIAPYAGFAQNGVKYVDLSNFAGTPTEKNAVVNAAQAAGYKVITNKNSAADVQNITDAFSKMAIIKAAFDPQAQDNFVARDTYGAALTKLAQFAQTNPDAAAIDTFNDSALDILKAMSGTQGFRGGQSIIAAVKSTFPQITDTKAVADQKIKNIEAQINARQEALVGKPSAADQLLIGEAKAKDSIKGFVGADSNRAAKMNSDATVLQQTLGRIPTAAEFIEAYPEYSSSPASSSASPQQGQSNGMIGGFGSGFSMGTNI